MTAWIDWKGFHEFKTAIDEIQGKVKEEAYAAVKVAAYRLQRRAAEKATRRPGPNVISGEMRRGIKVQPIEKLLDTYRTEVGPTLIYSRRVELGYRGTDALGRHYAQPEYPYFEPAYHEVSSEFAEIWEAHMRRAL